MEEDEFVLVLRYDLHKTKYSLIDGISESERFKMVEEVN